MPNLELNKNKVCFWKRYAGDYKLGDITVAQIWHSEGVCKGSFMWHVIVDGKTVISWAYLKDAKKSAHKIDAEVRNEPIP